MTAQQAYDSFNSITVVEALNTTVPFGKNYGKKVSEITFGYADWVRENIQAAYADEAKFKFLYAVAAIFNSEFCICPDSNNEILANCIKKEIA